MTSPRDIIFQTRCCFESGEAAIWYGPPGYGKTYLSKELARQLHKEYKAQGKRMGWTRIFMATKGPTDIDGLPWKGERTFTDRSGKQVTVTVTDPAMPTWGMCEPDFDTGERLPFFAYDIVFMVIEEWGQGDLDTKRAAANLLQEGGTGTFYLPEGSPRLALSNRDARDGVTKEFDFIIGRRQEWEFTGDAEQWEQDFANWPYQHEGKTWQVMDVTKAWATQNQAIFFEPKPQVQGPWCNPRTLTAWDRYAQVVARHNGGEIPHNDAAFIAGTAGLIGMPAARSVLQFLQFRTELPSYEAIVNDPDETPVPVKGDLRLLIAYELAARTKPKDIVPLMKYVHRLPQAQWLSYVAALLRRDYETFHELPVIQQWIARNSPLISILTSLTRRQ